MHVLKRKTTKKKMIINAAATSGSSKSLLKLLSSQFVKLKLITQFSTPYGSSGWDLPWSSFSNISTSLSIGRSRVVVAVVTLTDLTCPFESGCTSITRAMLQSFLGARSSTISTRSPCSKFLRGRFHFTLCSL